MSPPQPPIKVEVMPRAIRIVGLVAWICKSRAKGASFCQVDRISPVVRSSPWSTSGSHVCSGARPTFKERARIAMVVARGWDICKISHCPVSHALVVLANRRVAAPVA